MAALLQILVLTAFLVAGALLHRLRLAPPARITDRLIKLVLWILLAVMGFRLGNSRELASRLGEIGLLAGATAVLALAGTILCIMAGYVLVRRFGPGRKPGGSASGSVSSSASGCDNGPATHPKPRIGIPVAHFRGPALLLAMVVAGLALGRLLPEFPSLDYGTITTWVLNALLFLIGVQFAQSGLSLRTAFVRVDTILVPLATILGSLVGGLLVSALFRLGAGKGMALAAGFGWYSLSGVLITNLGDAALGSAAFLANMMREALALLLIPLLARTPFPYTAIGAGGATAMDVTLPLIEQCTGPESVPVSFTSGALLSLLVPVLVPLVYSLG